MGQDGLARRQSEAKLFSEAMLRLAARHRPATPVSPALCREITELEC